MRILKNHKTNVIKLNNFMKQVNYSSKIKNGKNYKVINIMLKRILDYLLIIYGLKILINKKDLTL